MLRALTLIRQAAVAAACLFIIVTSAARAPFARYLADDFGFAAGYAEHGFWGFQAHFYQTVGGRFTATALEMVVSAVGRSGVHWLVTAGLATLIASVAFASRDAVKQLTAQRDRGTAMLVALTATAALLETAPAFYQSIIWIAGFLIYGLPVALLGLVAIILLRDSGPGAPRALRPVLTLTLLLTFIAAGCSETAAVCQVAGFGTMTLLTRGRMQKIAGAAFAGSLIGLGIVAAAPGNAARRLALGKFLNPQPLADALILTAKGLLPRVLKLVLPIAPYLLMLIGLLVGRREPGPATLRSRALLSARSAAVIFAVVAATLLVGMWTLGSLPPPRALFVTNAWILACLLVVTLAWVDLLPSSRIIAVALTIATFAAIALGPLRNPQEEIAAVLDAREFARQSDAVDAFARAHPGQAIFISLPRMFEGLDVTSRSVDAWTNASMAKYYGVRSMALRDIAEPAVIAGPHVRARKRSPLAD